MTTSGTQPESEISARDLDDQDDRDELRTRYYGLLQELRVVLPGVQVLVAFMLTVPFAQRFADLDSLGKGLFGVALVSAVLSVVCLITPTALHRFGERRARGERLHRSIQLAKVGVVLLAVSMLLTLVVVSRFLFEPVVTISVVGACALATFGLWVVLPASLRRDDPRPG